MDKKKENKKVESKRIPCHRTYEIKKIFPQILEKHLGIVTSACEEAGIPRETYYSWRRSDPAFVEACEQAYEACLDFTESKLMQSINDKNITAIIYHLNYKGKKRGYGVKDEKPATFELKLSKQDEEIIKEYVSSKGKDESN